MRDVLRLSVALLVVAMLGMPALAKGQPLAPQQETVKGQQEEEPKTEKEKAKRKELEVKAYRIPRGASIFIEPMPQELDAYIRAEFVKHKVPLVISTDRDKADLVMAGTASDRRKRAWHEGVLSVGSDSTTAAVEIHERESGRLIWASTKGDRNIWWGTAGGYRKVASRIVKDLKKAIR